MSDNKREITSLNREWMTFDLDNLSVEELERRLELSLAILPIGGGECDTNTCDVNCMACTTNTCGTNCE